MSDLTYTVEVTGLKDVEQLEKTLDRLHNTLNAGLGSGKSLEEMRKTLVGMRGQASVIADLRDSIKGLNTATDQLSKNFDSGFKQLDRTFKQGFQLVLDRVNMFGAEYGNALGTQLTKGMESAGQKAKTSGEKLAGELKNIRKKLADSSTVAYEGLVSGNPLQKLNEKTAKELVELQAHGARLSSFHKTAVDEYKKYGTLYTQEMSALDAAKQRTRDKELNLERSFNAELNKVYAQRANIAAKAAVGSTTMQGSRFATNISMTGDSSSMLNYASSVDKARDAQDKLRASADPLRSSLRALAVDGNDTHSAMRGLASGFNMLWLTWGKLAPLFAGAGISYTLTRAFSVGSEVEYQIRFMEELGHTADATGKRIEGAGGVIRQELRKLNEESMFSIVELSKAMTDLGQTNYSVAESLQILRPATALATAGLVDLNTATETLIQVNALFGRTAEDTGRTAAQLFHITKSSVLNVEDLAGAFRYASEVNTKFQGSLEESLILFSALSKAGIKDQAAGTAMINVYRDIYGRSGPAIKALEGLRKATGDTIKTFDELGKRRPIFDIFQDIHKAAQKLPLEIADKYLSSLYSARGGRTHFAIARDDAESLRKVLDELKNAKPEDLFKASEGLMYTTKGATEILKSTMTNTLDEVFEAYEKGFKDFIVALTAGIRSDEFKETLLQITAAAQGLFNVVKDNFDLISTFGKLLLGWGALKFTVSALVGLASAITGVAGVMTLANGGMIGMNASVAANTAVTGLNTMSQRASAQAHYQNMVAKALMAKGFDAETAKAAAATAATTVYTGAVTRANFVTRGFAATMAFMTGPVGLVVTALGILASIYYSTKSAAEDAAAGMSEASDRYTNKSLANISKEIKALTARNLVMGQQDEFSELEDKIKQESAAFAKATEDYLAMQARFEKAPPPGVKPGQATGVAALERLQEREKELNTLWGDLFEARRISAEAREKREAEAAKKAADAAKKAAKALEDLIKPKGTPDLNGNSFVDLNRDKELQALKAHYDAELAVANDYYNKSKQLLDGHRSANLISEEEYMVQSLQLSRSHEAEQLQVLEASLTAYTEASERRKAALESQVSGAKGKGKNMLLDQLKKETQEFEIFVTNYEKERAKVAAESYARVGETVLKLQTEVGKLLKSSEDFWDNAAVSSAAQKDADELAKKYKNMNTSILSMDSAMFEFEKAQKSTQSEVKKMNAALEKQLAIQKNLLQIELLSLKAAQASGRLTLDEAIQRATLISQFKEGIAELEGKIADNTEKGLELGAERGWDAFQKMREKQVEELANSMSEAVVDGLMSGDYKSIGKNIRDILQRELLRKPLTAIINGVMGGIVGSISDAIFGGGGGSGGVAGSLGGLSNVAGSLSNLNTAYSIFSQGLVGSIAAPIAKLGATFGSSAMTSFAAGMKGATLAPGLAGPTTAGASGAMGAGATVAKAVPWVAGAVAIAAAFGAFRKTKVVDTGIMGTLGVEGGIHDFVQKRKSGSLFSGPKYTLEDHGVSSFDKPMQDAFSAMRTAAIDMGKILNLATDHLKDFTTVITLDSADSKSGTRGLSLKGLSDEEVQAKVQQALEQANNELAQQLIGTWEKVTTTTKGWVEELLHGEGEGGAYTYTGWRIGEIQTTQTVYKPSEFAREGETAIETLTRLAQSLSTVNGTLDLLGLKLYEGSLAGGDLASKLADLFGGLEAFTSVTSGYYQNFYSEEERFRKAGETVNASLKSIGVQLDVFGGEAAKIQYRVLVERAFAEGNQELAAQLLQMSAAFSEVANAAEQATRDISGSVSGLTGTITRELTAAYDAMNDASSVLEKIQSAMGIVTSSLSREAQLWQALGKADYRTQIEIASELSDLVIKRHQVEQQNAEKLLDFGKSLQAYVNSLKIGNLSTFTPAEKLAEAGKQYTDTLKKAQAGDEDALHAIQGASSSYLDLARQYYASSDDYTRIFESVTNSLESLGVKSQSEAQMQLEVSSGTLNELKKLEAIVQQAYNTASTDFSVQKDLLQQQIDQMLRTADGIEKVQALLAGLPYGISSQFNVGSASTPASGAGASSYEALAKKYVSIIGPQGGVSDVNHVKQYAAKVDQGQLDYELKAALALLSDPGDRQELLDVFKNIAQLRGLTINGSHANGLSYVPYDGYVAELHEGERVLTAQENSMYTPSEATRDSTEMSIMAAEIRILNAKLDKLTEQNERLMSAQIRATVESSNANSERVVEGITKATERAAYATTIEKGYK